MEREGFPEFPLSERIALGENKHQRREGRVHQPVAAFPEERSPNDRPAPETGSHELPERGKMAGPSHAAETISQGRERIFQGEKRMPYLNVEENGNDGAVSE